jgi:hypothetical protein
MNLLAEYEPERFRAGWRRSGPEFAILLAKEAEITKLKQELSTLQGGR